MKYNIYNIILSSEVSTKTGTASAYSLHRIVDEFIQKNYKELHITIDEEYFKEQTEKKYQKTLKNIFHNSRRNFFYHQYKSQKISEDTYRQILASLSTMKRNSKTIDDFKNKYKNYIKTLDSTILNKS